MPDNLKSGIESLSGYSMDDVKVHYNSSQPAQLNALAYAQGTDIHVAPGQEKHLAHEAWHVVQQKQGRVKPTKQMKLSVPVNDDKGLENEADVMGAKAMQMKREEKGRHAFSNRFNGIVQRVLRGSDNGALNSAFGTSKSKGTEALNAMASDNARWTAINDWIKAKKIRTPSFAGTVSEVAAYFGVTATEPVVVEEGGDEEGEEAPAETSDIKLAYNVKTGCALQALIRFKTTVLTKTTAKALHDHIWATADYAKYKDYDISWPTLYTDQGITMNTDNEGKKVSELTETGTYIVEVHGHMMVAVKPARGAVTLQQDGGNAIGKLTDVIKKSFKKA